MERIHIVIDVQCRSIIVFNSRSRLLYLNLLPDLEMLIKSVRKQEGVLLLTAVLLSCTSWQISTAKGS